MTSTASSFSLRALYQRAFAPYSAPAHARLLEYAAGLPASIQPALRQLASKWFVPAAEFSGKPYAPVVAQFFGITDRDAVVRSVVAGLMMEAHCCAQDARIDGHLGSPDLVVPSESLSNLLLAESLAEFAALAGDPVFWKHVQRAFADLAEGYAVEALPPEQQDLFQSVTNRAAPFHILVAALGLHAKQPEKIEACSQMARHLLFWFQIVDDLSDWPEDLRHGRSSYLLHRVRPQVQEWSETGVANGLFLFGGAETLLDECVVHLEAALAIAETGPGSLPSWLRVLVEHHRDLRRWCLESKREFLASVSSSAHQTARPEPLPEPLLHPSP